MTTNTEIYSNPDKFREHLQNLQNPITENPAIEGTEVKEENHETHTEETTLPDEETSIQETAAEDEPTASNESYKENKFIPKSRFNEINKRNKELEEFAASERDARIRLETQLQMLQEQYKTPEKHAPQVPDLEQLDALDQEAHQVYIKKIRELESKVEQVTTATSQQAQNAHKQNIIKAQREAFEQNHTDYKEALEHLKAVETKVAKNFYKTEAEAAQAVFKKYEAIADAAVTSNLDVAEVLYNIAKDYGYNSVGSKKETTPKGAPNIDAINRNMAKTASIGSLGNMANHSTPGFDIKNCLRDPKDPSSGIDPEKWKAEAMKRR